VKGFYSPIDKLAAELPRTKGTGAEFMTELSKRPGYKPQEAQDRDLQALMAMPKMAREEFLAQLKAKPAPKLQDTVLDNAGAPTQYDKWTLPGGTNYREILMRMPHDEQRAKEFSDPASGHWDTPDVLAHVRAKDRLIPDTEGPHAVKVIGGGGTSTVKFKTPEEAQRFAEVKHQGGFRTEITPLNHKKLLHIEEIQSDWHQKGREHGYATPESLQEFRAVELRHKLLKQKLDEAKAQSESAENSLKRKEPLFQQPDVRARYEAARVKANNDLMDLMPQVMKAQAEVQDFGHKMNSMVPNAPFKKNWHELALKKMIHHAAEQGYHGIVITPGEEQANRYDLSKHVGMVSYHPEQQRFQAFKPNRETVINEAGATPERVAELIGKDAAARLMKAPKAGDHHYLEGEDLRVGGEGMKGFYDKIVPSFLNQFGKKYGAKVGTTHITGPNEEPWGIGDAANFHQMSSSEYLDHPNRSQLERQFLQARNTKATPVHHFPITPEMREDVTKNGVPLYAEGGEVEVRPTVKDETIQRKIPEMESAAKAFQAGEIKHKDYDKVVNKHKPVKPYTFVPQPASDEDADRALMTNKKPHWRGHEQWPAGRKVGLRLDIPAYEGHGVWVNSIHDEEGKGEDKRKTAYGSVSSVKNATFDAGPSKAIKVATGEDNKSPFARIHGELHHMTEDEAVEHMKEYLNHPGYAQVGMDPRRHGFFYDRKTMQPVTHSAHVVQIGPLVLAHKPKYGKRETYAAGGDVKPVGYTKEKVTVSPSLDQMRYELISVKHSKKVK